MGDEALTLALTLELALVTVSTPPAPSLPQLCLITITNLSHSSAHPLHPKLSSIAPTKQIPSTLLVALDAIEHPYPNER